jgi:RND family efflux transporter MFP subunit
MVLLSLLLLACSSSSDAPASATPSADRSALVEVGTVRQGSLADTWTLTGELRALERAELAAGASGAVDSVRVREGDEVTAGTLLLEVDSRLALAELSSAKAAVQRAEATVAQLARTVERVGRVGDQVLGAEEIDQAETALAVARADRESARAQAELAAARLARHRVRAPFPGVVARRIVDPGDWVDPGEPVLDLVRLDGVEVRIDAPLAVATQLRKDDTVQLPGTTGTVLGVVPALDPTSRTSRIRIRPDGPLEGFLPGSPVEVQLALERSDGVVVPRDALVTGPTETRVFKVVEGQARSVVVTPLTRTASEVLVATDDLAAGDTVVVRGNERLRPDQPVRIR